MRNLIALLFLVLTTASCTIDKEVNNDLINRIPTDSKIIVHTDNLEDLNQFFKTNELYNQLDDLSRLKEIKKAASFLNDYDLKDDAIIALSIEGKNEVVLTLITSPLKKKVDSAAIISIQTYNKQEILKTQKDNNFYYSLNHKGVHLASSSRLVIESLIRRDVSDYIFDDSFKHIYRRTKSGTTFFIKATEKKWLEQFLMGRNINDKGNYAQWYQLEVQSSNAALQLDGVITYRDSLKMDHELYNNIKATENHIQEIVPVSLRSLKSVTYRDPKTLVDNLKRYHSREMKIGSQLKEILENTEEMSEVYLEKSQALVFTLKPYEAVFMNLDSLSTAKFTYRDQTVYELDQPIQTAAIQPLIKAAEYKFVTVIGQHLIFSNSSTTPEEFISNYQNKTVLAEQSWWQEASNSLSNSSSLLKITSLKELKTISEEIEAADLKVIDKLDEEDYPLLISQYVHEDEYAHYHIVVPFASGVRVEQQVSQLGSYKSPDKIIAGPFLFPNHLNNNYDVVFQDENFNLHLISETGKKYWSKKLDAVILGEIEVTDAYKNGRKQLAFATRNAVYFLDRNGKDVNAFPKRFNDAITQPLSVFDYDNKREYRFLITQGKQLFMLNREGNTIAGFKYKKGAVITSQPKHFRVGSKDYIAFTKGGNGIALLNRTGGIRTEVKDEVKAVSDLLFFQNKAIALTEEGKMAQIDLAKGTVSLSGSYSKEEKVAANLKLKLTQNNNVLQINNKKVALPYGTYLPAQITHLSSGDFIHVVETGESRVYILDDKGAILSSLPVYGKTKSAIAQSKGRYLATLDGDDVIIYKW